MAESTTSTNIPQWLQDFYSGVMTRGQQLGGAPYQAPQFPLTAAPTQQVNPGTSCRRATIRRNDRIGEVAQEGHP